jgi:hypothetical protein
MKHLALFTTLLAVLVLGACDSGVAIHEQTSESQVFAKHHGDNGALKETASFVYEFYYDENFPEFTDIEIGCLGGLVRSEGRMAIEMTKISTPGGRLVANWTINYDESELWADMIDEVGGERLNPGPEHDWVLITGNQNVHDVATVDGWSDDILASTGPGMHQFSMHEWYRNTLTGEVQTMNYPSVYFYEGFDGESLNITRYMDNGWCPGNSGLK